jgi:hypothetical protein
MLVYNYLAVDRFPFASKEPLPKGKVQLKVVSPTTAEADSAKARP